MMSYSRYQQIVSGHTSAVMKIYEHVPMNDTWDINAIVREMIRQGVNATVPAVAGCLDSLKRSGLVKENRDGFRRVPVRSPATKISALTELADALEEKRMPNIEKKNPSVDLVDRIGELSQRMNIIMARHNQEMTELANLVADVAIDVQTEREAGAEDLKKYRQLKELLAT